MYEYVPDNYDIYREHQARLDKALEECPVCDWCGQHMQEDHYYHIDGDDVCEACIEDCRRSF